MQGYFYAWFAKLIYYLNFCIMHIHNLFAEICNELLHGKKDLIIPEDTGMGYSKCILYLYISIFNSCRKT